jgi:hypothetical protein
MTGSTVVLPDAGSVSASYRHRAKVVAPAAGLSLPGAHLKWYDVHGTDQTIPAGPFHLFPQSGTHRGTFCVWELGAVLHEQQAWIRYLYSARDDAARREYVADQYAGPVG